MKLSVLLSSFAIIASTALAHHHPRAAAAPSATPVGSSSPNSNPCALLVASAASIKSANPKETSIFFKPSEVYACQQDVPIVPDLAAKQIEWMQGFIQFQSTLAWLKNPPAGYDLPPVDLVGGLDNIGKKAASGEYRSEYDFELDSYNLITSVGDGHLAYLPFLIGNFAFFREVSLVSVSLDGVSLPKVYFLEDIQAAASGKGAKSTPPALVSINGVEVNEFILSTGYDIAFQSLDARFNVEMYNPSTSKFGNGGEFQNGAYFAGQSIYHSDMTTYVFDNGTISPVQNKALVGIPFDFNSGAQLLEKYIIPSPSKSSSSAPSSASASSAPSSASSAPSSTPKVKQLPNYPYPEVIHSGGYISGYFLRGDNYSDFAVLSIPSFFETQDTSLLKEYQGDVQKFLGLCQSANKTQLIIDVRGNPGGTAGLAYDVFKQLFPSIVPFSGSRIRGSDAANLIGVESSKLSAFDANNITTGGAETIYDYTTSLKSPDGASFTSWKELYGPVQSHGDIYSNIVATKFSDVTLDLETNGIVISGYGNNTDILPQIFASENITLLTDVSCTSTCGLFSNLLIDQGKIKTIAAGGRPNTNPIPIIGGSQGAESETWPGIQDLAKGAITIARHTTGNDSAETVEAIKVLEALTLNPPLNPVSFSGTNLNLRDSIAEGDTSLTPLQFTKKMADCRFFYMPGDILNVTYTWERIAKGVKTGKGLCINGGTGAPTTGAPGGSGSGSGSGGGSSSGNGTSSTSTSGASSTMSAMPVYTGGAVLGRSWGACAVAGLMTMGGMMWAALF